MNVCLFIIMYYVCPFNVMEQDYNFYTLYKYFCTLYMLEKPN